MAVKKVNEMSRGPQKRLPKYKAYDMAAECIRDALATAYYKFEDNAEYNALSEEEQQLVNQYYDELGTKLCKAMGKTFYTM